MTETIHNSTNTTEHAIIITRDFNAPRDLVFKAWTEPERAKLWWGPTGFTTPFFSIDLRPGGTSFSSMRSPEGMDIWSKGTFLEVIVPERIVITDSFADSQGNIVPASYYGMTGDNWPLEMLVTVDFEEDNGKTKMILRHDGIPPGENSEMCRVGWNQSFDKLDRYLESEIQEDKIWI